MTDAAIYGKKTSQIAMQVLSELEEHFGEGIDFAEVILERVMDEINATDRDDLNYKKLVAGATEVFWALLPETAAFQNAVEGDERCSQYIAENLETEDSEDVLDRVRHLANRYYSD